MQRKDGEGRKEGWRGGRHRGGKRETEKMSQSWTEKWRERTGEEKKESSLHTLFMLFKTFWVHMIGRHQCEALLCSHYGFDQRWQSEGGRQKEGSRHVISPLPDIWIAAHISDFSGIKKKKKKIESHVRWKTTESVESVSARSSSLTKEMWLKKDQAAVRVDLMW